jgi:hypothetical protein
VAKDLAGTYLPPRGTVALKIWRELRSRAIDAIDAADDHSDTDDDDDDHDVEATLGAAIWALKYEPLSIIKIFLRVAL